MNPVTNPSAGWWMVAALVLATALAWTVPAWAQDIPSLRIPRLVQPPTIDGKIDPDEWSGAARVTGFQDFRARSLTLPDLQPTWWIGYDDGHLYFAQYFPVYPKGTIKAAVKHGDNGGQAGSPDSILGDDHVEIQICDLPKREQAIKQYFFKIMTNPYGAVVDQRTEWSVGWMGLEWESNAIVRVNITDDGWSMEMAVPWKNLSHPTAPADGTPWFVQLVSAGGADTFYNAWQPVLWTAWDLMPEIVFDSQAPVFQLLSLGDPAHGKLDVSATVRAAQGKAPIQMSARVVGADGKEIYAQTSTATADGTVRPLRLATDGLQLTDQRYHLQLLATQDKTVLYQASMAFTKASETDIANAHRLLADARAGAGQPTISSCYYNSYRKLTADCDVDILKIDPALRAARRFRTRIVRPGQDAPLVAAEARIDDGGRGHIQTDTPVLEPGDYHVVTEIVADDGKVLASRTDPFTQRSFPWEGNTLGEERVVIPPFTPVVVKDAALNVWGREYQFADNGFPRSILSKGQDLLAEPIRLEATIADKELTLQGRAPGKWTHAEDYDAVRETQGTLGEHADVTVRADTEFDGTTFYTLTLAPNDDAPVQRLDLVIPLSRLTDWMAMRSSGRDMPYGIVPKEDGVFWDSSKLAAAAFIHGTFLPYCVVSDGERGLSWAADSDQDWILDDASPSFFLEKKGEQVLMRVRLVNTPSALKRVRTIRFMLTAMPTKPLPDEHRYRSWGTVNAPFGWMNGFQGSCMWAYGTGPTVSFYTQEQYDILKDRLEQDRRRVRYGAENVVGPKYLPMSAWYVATNTMGYAMPEYDVYSGEWTGTTSPQPWPQQDYINFKTEWGVWSTPRQQSRAHADLTPSSVDCRVYSFDQHQKQAGMNGYWWDHSRFWTNGDPIKNGTYVRDDGSVQGVFNITAMRRMMQRMAVVSWRNGLTPFHGYYSHGEIGPVGSFMQWSWAIEGPWYVNSKNVSLLDNIRGGLDGIRVLLQTYQGLPVTMRNETLDRESDDPWQTRSCLGVALLFDVGLGFEGGAVNGPARDKVLADLSKFDYFNPLVQWTPYWRAGDLVRVTGGDVVTTVYTRMLPGQTPGVLLVLFNQGDAEATVSIAPDAVKLLGTADVSLHDLERMTPQPMAGEKGEYGGIKIRRHDFRLLILGPRASGGD